ncbi:mucin-desulfating sulfatase (N-acetylglucosamine-6-sulfatase) [Paenibacillus algicola]|uniref:Mucin-desulfating sulfatase (N-acetylglucosamine-6-sulfatase) n=1 Tax=Paenibacillus algicola TaxID=2565926 RepID=A0A4P8XMZ0_9BACL|nr:sulfatase [Paenibacillus algicola]QCT03635.1 mucin-desulfating sulfatase (N-acetylglucosamine-6-sulfatase) [Paenibacillus algicola]
MTQRPNIVYIMSDDHASNAISCYGSRLSSVFKTPNLDRIAREGVRMDHYYSTNAICTPARATIMTGQYGHINGVRTLSDAWDPAKGPNMAELFMQHGYETAIFGKWHLHCEPSGFYEYSVLTGQGGQGTYQNPEFISTDGQSRQHTGYVTDIITDMTVDWLQKRSRRKTGKPFFLMCHHKASHDFWEYAARHEHLLDGIQVPVPESLFEDKCHRSSASRNYGSSVTPRNAARSLYADFCEEDYVTGPLRGTEHLTFEEKGFAAYQKYLKDYLRTVAGIDDSVGRILAQLEAAGELEQTIILYTSDQGMFLGEHDYQDKRWSYEESLRAPLLIRYPQEIPAGRVCTDLMANLDMAPTLLDYAGIPVPEVMQGVSQRDVIRGETETEVRSSIYFRYWMHLAHKHDNPAHYGIRTKEYKLIYYYGLPLDASGALQTPTPTGWELYDMVADPYELCNLYEDTRYADVIQSLKEKLGQLKAFYHDDDLQYPELLELLDVDSVT